MIDRTPLPDFSRNVICVLGLPFDAIDMAEACRRVRQAADERKSLLLSTANLHFVIAACHDAGFRHSVVHSQLSLADGMPIVWISRLLGLPIVDRVPGSGLFEALTEGAPEAPLDIYFFGAPDGVAEKASEQVNGQASGLHCVGFEAPGFVPIDAMSQPDQIQRINAASPDFLIVSLGAEKGQAWIEHNKDAISAPVVSHLGAVVGFAAGTLKRAPSLMQRAGLEWLWRIKEEPALWRRYAVDGVAFSRLLVNSVIPLYCQRVYHSWFKRSEPLTTAVMHRADAVRLKLGGACEAGQLPALREALAEVSRADSDIVIDMSDVTMLDAAAMGLLLLLHGYQRDVNKSLRFQGVSRHLRRQFSFHCTGFLLDREPVRTPEAAGRPRIA